MIELAFYTAPGTWTDRLIRIATQSRYSHVEMFDPAMTTAEGALCISASPRDGGVRLKRIVLFPDRWEIVRVGPWAPADALRRAGRFGGARYDLLAAVASPWLTLSLGRDRWFCSELIAWALGFPKAQRMSPQDLWDGVSFVNREVRG